MILLIPSYEPSDALPDLVAQLLTADPDVEIVVVDDGSGERYASLFARAHALGATVLTHDANRGKGAALKTGFAHVLAEHPGDDVVTADADGQHTPRDIVALADELRRDAAAGTPTLILGCRAFSGHVPLRSRAGNAVARGAFRVAAGWRLSDTQTGLRGIPSAMLPWLLEQPGDRFEYEQNVLLRSRRAGWPAREAPIETVYLDDNASSHFRPVADSLRVGLPLLAFAGSSLLAFAVDTVALVVLTALTGWLVPSIVVARVLSASVNFAVNRRLVFQRRTKRDVVRHAVRYTLLAGALLASNIVWMTALTEFGIPLLVAKIATEVVLFITSYGVQKSFVFAAEEAPQPLTAPQNAHSRRIVADGRVES
ncbi:bifunctional glycosyltransferase family 2/GtrA family protein [Microbacterium sp. NPDC019599]|uniref:bifunctional glycosyltransferase family 2/GtrA family protein n=1 Tax=Microbacterium sp. NPDC019599 TaxID=3154690 RepID=UPI0033D8EDBA